MEPLKPIALVKYLLLGLGMSASFTNLFDCVVSASPWIDYVMYVGVTFIGSVLLLVFHSNIYLCGALALFGLVSIYVTPVGMVSWGAVLLIFAKRIAENNVFSIFVYAGTAIILFANIISQNLNASNVINVLLTYSVVYYIDYLIYTDIRGKSHD